MARNKSQDKKDFLIAVRKRTGASVTNAPVWAMQKAGKRIWNRRGKRHWRTTDFGLLFKRKEVEQGKVKTHVKKLNTSKKRRRPKKKVKGR